MQDSQTKQESLNDSFNIMLETAYSTLSMLRKIEDVTFGPTMSSSVETSSSKQPDEVTYNMEQKINELRKTNLKINDITSFLLNRIS